MDLEFIGTGSVKGANRETEFFPTGRFSGLLLEIFGTTATGETLTLDDIGTIEVQRGGRTLQLQEYEYYSRRTDIKGGFPNKPSGSAATAEELSAVIPFGSNKYPNVMQIRDNKEAWANLAFDAILDTRFGANPATYELYGIKAPDVFESYELKILSHNISVNAAGREDKTLPVRNLISLFIKDPSDVIDKVQLIVDGQTIRDSIPFRTLKTMTNIENRIESAGQPWAEIIVAEQVRESSLNESSKVGINFSAAGTAEIVMVSADWLKVSRARQNLNEVAAFLQQKARREIAAGVRQN